MCFRTAWFWFSESLSERVARLRERSELDDVSLEEQSDGPVDEDAYLAIDGGDHRDVVGAMEEPRGEATELDAHDAGDPLVPA